MGLFRKRGKLELKYSDVPSRTNFAKMEFKSNLQIG